MVLARLLARVHVEAHALQLTKEDKKRIKRFNNLNLFYIMMENFKSITITLTQSCNLSCVYCYERNKTSKVISFDTIKKIIDEETMDIYDYDMVEFDLFGGEPFLEFELIKKTADYLEKYRNTGKCRIFITTNGTLVKSKEKKWLSENSDWVTCGLSLDGTREMHNINRSKSYDSIDLDFFLNQYPFQDIKMTVSQQTLPYLADGVIELHKKGFLVSCNLANGIDWSNSDNENTLSEELEKLIGYYLQNPDIVPCSMLNMSLVTIGMDVKPMRYCGAGKYMHTYDVDGTCYPCHYFMPLAIGKENSQKSLSIQLPEDYLPEEKIDENCKACVLNSACPNCFGANFQLTNDIYKRDENLCKLTKIIFKARSYFCAKLWESGTLNEEDEDIPFVLKAIEIIQKEL